MALIIFTVLKPCLQPPKYSIKRGYSLCVKVLESLFLEKQSSFNNGKLLASAAVAAGREVRHWACRNPAQEEAAWIVAPVRDAKSLPSAPRAEKSQTLSLTTGCLPALDQILPCSQHPWACDGRQSSCRGSPARERLLSVALGCTGHSVAFPPAAVSELDCSQGWVFMASTGSLCRPSCNHPVVRPPRRQTCPVFHLISSFKENTGTNVKKQPF